VYCARLRLLKFTYLTLSGMSIQDFELIAEAGTTTHGYITTPLIFHPQWPQTPLKLPCATKPTKHYATEYTQSSDRPQRLHAVRRCVRPISYTSPVAWSTFTRVGEMKQSRCRLREADRLVLPPRNLVLHYTSPGPLQEGPIILGFRLG